MQFARIAGQQAARETFLKGYRENRLAHALLLRAPEGVGELAFANAIAQFINCDNPSAGDSCGSCPACKKISRGIHPDIHYVLPTALTGAEGKKMDHDALFPLFREQFFRNPYFSFREWIAVQEAENKQLTIHIAEVRDLKRKLMLKAFEGKFKVAIFWGAEKINQESANALLKLLEEPPDDTILILTCNDPGQLIMTIRSRCQMIHLHRVEDDTVAKELVANHGLSSEAASQVASLADGSISRAIEIACESDRSMDELFQTWLRAAFRGNYVEITAWTETIARSGREHQKLMLMYFLQKLRNTLFFQFGLEDRTFVTPQEREFQEKFRQFIRTQYMGDLSRLLEDTLFYISRNANAQMAYIMLCLRTHALLTGKSLI